MPKVLVVEEPRQDIKLYRLNEKNLEKFGLDETDLQTMQEGGIVWPSGRQGTAYSVEELEEGMEMEVIE